MISFIQDLISNPLAPQELSGSGVEMGNQMKLTHFDGNEQEELELRNMEVPPSSMEIDGGKVDVSNDKEPLDSSLTPRESKKFLTEEESCLDATMVRCFAPIAL